MAGEEDAMKCTIRGYTRKPRYPKMFFSSRFARTFEAWRAQLYFIQITLFRADTQVKIVQKRLKLISSTSVIM